MPSRANWPSTCTTPITPQLKIPLRLLITTNYLLIADSQFKIRSWPNLFLSQNQSEKKQRAPSNKFTRQISQFLCDNQEGGDLNYHCCALWHVSCLLEFGETGEFEAPKTCQTDSECLCGAPSPATRTDTEPVSQYAVCQYASMPVCQYANMQLCQYTMIVSMPCFKQEVFLLIKRIFFIDLTNMLLNQPPRCF